MFRRFAIFPWLFVLALLQPPAGSLAQATPELPAVPLGSDCTVEPMSVDYLLGMQTEFLFSDDPTTQSMMGTTASPDTWMQVQAAVVGAIACANSGSLLGFFGAFTDNGLTNLFGVSADAVNEDQVRERILTLEATEITPIPQFAMVSLLHVADLADGRIGALVATMNMNREVQSFPTIDYFIFDPASFKIDRLLDDALGFYSRGGGPGTISGCSGRCDCPLEEFGSSCGMADVFKSAFMGSLAQYLNGRLCGTRARMSSEGIEIFDLCEWPG
jgi:hypothetical protein